jgi:hypothetical protein
MNDEQLEQAFRDGLSRRAEQVYVDPSLVSRARSGAGARRRRTWVALGGAAAAVALVAGLVTALTDGDRPAADRGTDPSTTEEDQPDAWRTERWGDLQVEVPADWGYGGAPGAGGGLCSPGAVFDSVGDPVSGEPPAGYVGRPIDLGDACSEQGSETTAPDSPYVWLGAGVAPGTIELPGGYTQETITTQGTRLTVATQDPAVRARILESAGGNEKCLSELDRPGEIAHDRADDPNAEPVILRVCAYRLGVANDGWWLTYATDLDTGALRAYQAAVDDGAPPQDQCPTIDYQPTAAVVLELIDADGGVLRQDAVNLTTFCAGIGVDASLVWELYTTKLTAEMARPWAVGGVRSVLYGSAAVQLAGPEGQ